MKTVLNIAAALFVRCVLLCHVFLAYWKASASMVDKTRWIFTVFVTFQFLEATYAIFVRKGQEYKWFCPCFLCYFVAVTPAIWILEIDNVEKYDTVYKNVNGRAVESQLPSISGLTIPLTLNASVWVALIEQSLLFLVILSRWLMQRGCMTKDDLSQLLFTYMGLASDNLELFSLFDEAPIRKDRNLTFIILSAWTLSLLQFAFVLVTRKEGNKFQQTKKGFFTTDIWSLCLIFLVADGPFLAIRLYSMITYTLITYTIIFFTLKNILVIIFLINRIIVVFCCNSANENTAVEPLKNDDKISPPLKRNRNEDIFQAGGFQPQMSKDFRNTNNITYF